MQINRKDVYRVTTGAINYINEYGTKTAYNELNTYYCIPVRNSRGKIITFNELITGKPLVKRVYLKNECCEEYEDMYYKYAYDKGRDVTQIGDVEIILDQDYETDELRKYVGSNREALSISLDNLELRAIASTSEGYSEDKTMEYYDKKLYICPLDDDFIIVTDRRSPFGTIVGFREIITGRKVIRRTGDEYNEYDYLINLNRSLMDPEINVIDRTVLATRELSVPTMEGYMELTPEEVEAKISNYLAKLSRERVIDYEHKIK